MSLTSRLVARLVASQTNSLDLADGSFPLSLSTAVDLADGTGAGQADRLFSDQRTITASGSESIDLAGSLVDAFGATLTFARIKALYVAAAAGNTNNVLVGGAGSNGFVNWVSDVSDVVVVRPGGVLLLAAPDATAYAVTAATGDLLKIANSGSGTGVTYDIVIIGASA
jgi:hypothetical protein